MEYKIGGIRSCYHLLDDYIILGRELLSLYKQNKNAFHKLLLYTLEHEYIHRVLLQHVGYDACIDYDNIHFTTQISDKFTLKLCDKYGMRYSSIDKITR